MRRTGGMRKREDWMLFAVVTFLALHLDGDATAGNFATCRKSLGMQSGALPDNAISSSSAYDEPSVGAINARIRTERNGGAWCPKNPISKNVYEWIELDLQEMKVVTQVETQGRFGNGQGQEFAEAYMIEYRRNPTDNWIRFRDRRGNERFPGNTNTYIAEMRDIIPPIITRWLRVIPYSSFQRTVCMRIELYGCPWRDGVVSYNMPQGEKRGSEVDLLDFTYDYNTTDSYLSGGLGQLTDGVEGHSNFRMAPESSGRKGYEWVGWKNDTDHPRASPIEILFAFDRVRNFTAVRFHSNNMFTKDVRVFRRAILRFSVTGSAFQELPVVFDHPQDSLIEFARNVIVPISHRVGRYVRVELYFDTRWILISEVRFESEVVRVNLSKEPEVIESTFMFQESETKEVDGEEEEDGTTTPSTWSVDRLSLSPMSLDPGTVTLASSIVIASVLIVSSVTLFCILRRRRSAAQSNKAGSEDCVKTNPFVSPSPYAPPGPIVDLPLEPSSRCHLVQTSSNGNFSTGATHVNGGFRDAESTSGVCSARGPVPVSPGGATFRRQSEVKGQGAMNKRQLPEIPQTAKAPSQDYLSDTNTSTYDVPGPSLEHQFQPLDQVPSPCCLSPTSSCESMGTMPPPLPQGLAAPRALYVDRCAVEGLQGSCGSSLYAVQPSSFVDTELWNVPELDRSTLIFVRKIGEGIFGEVHLCQINVDVSRDAGFEDNRQNGDCAASGLLLFVAVKVLNKSDNIRAKSDFLREASLMSKLTDSNIVTLVGACTRDEPFAIAVEYMTHGDLNQFLHRHRPAEPESLAAYASGLATSCPLLSYGCLIYMAMQVASGMKYLEGLNIVHRDLASRNCLVGHNYQVKISDFGMSRSLYARDYYRFEGRAMLPIRWMAWESVMLGKFTTMTDVWSFGVTLWEVMTFARRQPFDTLTDEEVIENCAHYYRRDCDQLCLPPPHGCPKEIVDLMRECWNPEDAQRPTFREIHMFLERKNHGYRPTEGPGFDLPLP